MLCVYLNMALSEYGKWHCTFRFPQVVYVPNGPVTKFTRGKCNLKILFKKIAYKTFVQFCYLQDLFDRFSVYYMKYCHSLA